MYKEVEGGKIVVLDGSQIKEDKGNLVLAMENKDGSTDTYCVSGATAPERAPTAVT